jgi:hypothetical protein
MAAAVPDITYADIIGKIGEVDQDLRAFDIRQQRFVVDLHRMINYFVYNLQPQQIAAAIAAAAAAGDIDPDYGRRIFDKFEEVRLALQKANSDADKLAIFDSLRIYEPVLRRLADGDPNYNGLPGQPAGQPPGYPLGPAQMPPLGYPPGAGGDDAPPPPPILPVAPNGPIARQPSILDPDDAARANEIADLIDAEPDENKRPLVKTSTGREGRATDVFRDPATGEVVGFQVTIPANSPAGMSRRVNLRGGSRRKKRPIKSKKRGGYKSRKSRRRTFR